MTRRRIELHAKIAGLDAELAAWRSSPPPAPAWRNTTPRSPP